MSENPLDSHLLPDVIERQQAALKTLPVNLADITLAQYRLKTYLSPTPLEFESGLPNSVWLKLENLNPMRSFKVRGALNAMLALTPEARGRGLVAASSGNHAQGIAYAAKLLGASAQIVMPEVAPKRKIEGVKRLGGTVILRGDYDTMEIEAHRLEREHGWTYISPYADVKVIAGAGTIGLEMIERAPDVQRVIVPVGGGGLISGIAVALKTFKPTVQIIGVNAAVSPDMYNLFYGKDLPLSHETLADALPGAIEETSPTREIVKALVDEIVLVDEDAIQSAMRWFYETHGLIGEGGGVVGIAAMLSGVIPQSNDNTVIVVSGGNVDTDTLKRVL